jgi:hypothetical protein
VSRSYTHVLTIYVTEAQHNEVARRAESRRVAMSDVVREAIDAHVKPRKGGKHCPALTAEQVATIRARRASGETLQSIAADYGVSHVAILKRCAEAARDVDVETAPPSAPPTSRVASARRPHPWRGSSVSPAAHSVRGRE